MFTNSFFSYGIHWQRVRTWHFERRFVRLTRKNVLVGFIHWGKRWEMRVRVRILDVVEVVEMGTDYRANVLQICVCGEYCISKVIVALMHSFGDEVNTVSCIML